MEHDQQSSKSEAKAAGPRTRKNATPQVSSGAQAVFNLQHAAGNRAVAQLLSSSAQPGKVQRRPDAPTAGAGTSPLVVQRVSDSLQEALEKQFDKSEVDYDALALKFKKFVKTSGGTGDASESSGSDSSGKATSEKALKKRRDKLAQARSSEGRLLSGQDRSLKRQEERQKKEDQLQELREKAGPFLMERKLGKVLQESDVPRMSPPDLQDAIDDLEEAMKDQEARRKYARQFRGVKGNKQAVAKLYKGF